MMDQRRENNLASPLFKETSSYGRREISRSTGSVNNGVQLSIDGIRRESDFQDFLRMEDHFSFETQ